MKVTSLVEGNQDFPVVTDEKRGGFRLRYAKPELGNRGCCWVEGRSHDIRKIIGFNLQESFPHLLTKQLLNSYHVPGPRLRASETHMNEKSY